MIKRNQEYLNRISAVLDFLMAFLVYFFFSMACGKSYKKILKSVASIVEACIVISGLVIPLGYTLDVIKPENIHP